MAVFLINMRVRKTYQVYFTMTCTSSSSASIDHRYAYQIESNRYFELKLRPPRTTKRKPVISKQKTDRTEDELKANLHSLSLVTPDDDIQDIPMEDEETSFKIEDIPITMDLPPRRFNAALAVGMDDKLYIYGGTYENPGRGEMTIDDFHVIDLGKLDGVRELWNRTTFKVDGNEDGTEDEITDSSSDSSDNDEKMEDLNDNEPTNQTGKYQQQMDLDISSKETGTTSTTGADDDGTTPTPTSEEITTSFNPRFPAPLPFESIKSYYDRTGREWIILVADGSKAGRREAFVKAEGYWWECREEIREIEERMEESGVKEVVSVQFDKREKRR